jgi:hypothetical protein
MIKKSMLLFIMLIVTTMAAFPVSPYIQSPKGGENWALNSTQKITWNSAGLNCSIHIILIQNGRVKGFIVRDIPISTGSFDWQVGRYISGKDIKTVSPGAGFIIRIHGVFNNRIIKYDSPAFSISHVLKKM